MYINLLAAKAKASGKIYKSDLVSHKFLFLHLQRLLVCSNILHYLPDFILMHFLRAFNFSFFCFHNDGGRKKNFLTQKTNVYITFLFASPPSSSSSSSSKTVKIIEKKVVERMMLPTKNVKRSNGCGIKMMCMRCAVCGVCVPVPIERKSQFAKQTAIYIVVCSFSIAYSTFDGLIYEYYEIMYMELEHVVFTNIPANGPHGMPLWFVFHFHLDSQCHFFNVFRFYFICKIWTFLFFGPIPLCFSMAFCIFVCGAEVFGKQTWTKWHLAVRYVCMCQPIHSSVSIYRPSSLVAPPPPFAPVNFHLFLLKYLLAIECYKTTTDSTENILSVPFAILWNCLEKLCGYFVGIRRIHFDLFYIQIHSIYGLCVYM